MIQRPRSFVVMFAHSTLFVVLLTVLKLRLLLIVRITGGFTIYSHHSMMSHAGG
jgi:hypothetical protein